MAEKKPSGIRFRLPWLLQPALTPNRAVAPEPPTQPPRTTTQTSEPPTQPPRTTTQTSGASTSSQRRPPGKTPSQAAPREPASPRQSPPLPPSVSAKSPATKSPIATTIEPVATQPTKETQTTTETTRPETPPPKQAQPPPSPPKTPPKPDSQPSSPKANPQKLSPPRMVAQPISSPPSESTPPQGATQPPSLVHVKPSQAHTPPQSPSRFVSKPQEKFPLNSNHVPQADEDDSDLAFNPKPKEKTKLKVTQTKSMNPHSTETKSQKPKRVSLQREIKDDISKFVHKISTSSPNQHMNEQPASVIIIAGENEGASMYLGSDVPKTDSKTGENQETKAIVNSNIQGINNSIMFNSSVTERNPGVHLGFHRNLRNSFMIQQSEIPPVSFSWIQAITILMIPSRHENKDDARSSIKSERFYYFVNIS